MVLAALLPVNVGLNLLMVRWLGLIGSPIAVGIIYYLAVLLLCLHIRFFRKDSTALGWTPWCSAAFNFRSCAKFLQLACPGILMVGTEWAAFEIVAIASGWGGAQSLAAQSVVMTVSLELRQCTAGSICSSTVFFVLQCDQILNTIPFGLGVAASSRIGNLLGQTSSHTEGSSSHRSGLALLRTSTLAAALLSTILGALVGLALMLGRWQLGALFSEDPGTIALVAHVLPLVAAFQVSHAAPLFFV
jgi:multidrug resistance protein, MATE family